MDFEQVVRVCSNFAIANSATLQIFAPNVQKLGILASGCCRGVCVERSKKSSNDCLWDVYSYMDGKTEVFPPVSSRDMLLNTLTGAWTTRMQAMSSLMDAKLADVHAALERNTKLMQKILGNLQLIEQKLLKKKGQTFQ